MGFVSLWLNLIFTANQIKICRGYLSQRTIPSTVRMTGDKSNDFWKARVTTQLHHRLITKNFDVEATKRIFGWVGDTWQSHGHGGTS